MTAEELTEGQLYEVVITNNAGLYRYRMGDVIRCTHNDGGTVTFTFDHRRDQVHSFAGENMTEADVLSAVLAAEEALGVSVADFCFLADGIGRRYIVYLEPAVREAGAQKLSEVSEDLLNAMCEAALMLSNPRYAQARISDSVQPCCVRILQPQTQLLYRDLEKIRRQSAPDQFKPIRLLTAKDQEMFFPVMTADTHF